MHLASHNLPALITASGLPLQRPSLREVARVAGLLRSLAGEDEMETTCDLAIVDELAAPDMLLQYSLHEPRRGRMPKHVRCYLRSESGVRHGIAERNGTIETAPSSTAFSMCRPLCRPAGTISSPKRT